MSKYIKRSSSKLQSLLISSRKIAKREAQLIKVYYPNFDVKIKGNMLFCEAIVKPDDRIEPYKFQIEYEPLNNEPKVKIISHDIIPKKVYHVYKNGYLCLYHPYKQKWKVSCNLFDTIIPWVVHWIIFYEVYKRNGGIWLGPEAEH